MSFGLVFGVIIGFFDGFWLFFGLLFFAWRPLSRFRGFSAFSLFFFWGFLSRFLSRLRLRSLWFLMVFFTRWFFSGFRGFSGLFLLYRGIFLRISRIHLICVTWITFDFFFQTLHNLGVFLTIPLNHVRIFPFLWYTNLKGHLSQFLLTSTNLLSISLANHHFIPYCFCYSLLSIHFSNLYMLMPASLV